MLANTSSDFSHKCPKCLALNFAEEKNDRGVYMLCCQNGKVKLHLADIETEKYARKPCPSIVKVLLTKQHPHSQCYIKNTRQVNNGLACASFIVNDPLRADQRGALIPGPGIRVVRIHAQCYTAISDPVFHSDGSDRQPCYSQLYFMDPGRANEYRESNPHNRNIPVELFEILDGWLREYNPWVQLYTTMRQRFMELPPSEQNEQFTRISMEFLPRAVSDHRRGNLPSSNDLAVIYVTRPGESLPQTVNYRVNAPRVPGDSYTRTINYTNRCVDPLVYPCLFPCGEAGWEPQIPYTGDRRTPKRQFVTMREFACYRFARRALPDEDYDLLHNSYLLTQQYICDLYLRIEKSNLDYVKVHNANIRSERFDVLQDALNSGDDGVRVGREIVILPASFHGSPRYMIQAFQDAMTVVSKLGPPDYFITMTCNPSWEEISKNITDPLNGTDIFSRVFRLKVKALLKDLVDKKALGEIEYFMYTIEWQKRGLPHLHLLLSVKEEDKPKTGADVDNVISAELPDPLAEEELHALVAKFMLHGPCGTADPNRSCTKNNKCTKYFPKPYVEETLFDDGISGYPKYRRRRDGKKVNKYCRTTRQVVEMTNQHVVPYNRGLLLKYNCHMNVEVCSTVKAVKYIYKYIYKGHDQADVQLQVVTPQADQQRDEVETFIATRYVSAPEAMWRILAFRIDDSNYTVVRLTVHLPGQQPVSFVEGNAQEAAQAALCRDTRLEAFFKLNDEIERETGVGSNLLYQNVPESYAFDSKQGKWNQRRGGQTKIIGRMYIVSPREVERYCLRLLLLYVKGPTSFDDLRTFNGNTYETFSEAADARGLIENESVWDRTMEEVSSVNYPYRIRFIFALILCFVGPPNAKELFERWLPQMAHDYINRLHLDPIVARFKALKYIERVLMSNGCSLQSFGLELPEIDISSLNISNEIADEGDPLNVSTGNIIPDGDDIVAHLNEHQKAAFETIIRAVDSNNTRSTAPKVFFVDGPGGTGKTYLYKAIMHALNQRRRTYIATAYTGIAATLLPQGTTIHSAFRVPIEIKENDRCLLSVQDAPADRIKAASVLFFDEASMIPNKMLDLIDLCLKDIMQNSDDFGGKIVVFGGDFRQVLPVIPNASSGQTVMECLKKHACWNRVKVLKLERNMRAQSDAEYAQWILKIGNGELDVTGPNNDLVEIRPNLILNEGSLEQWVFPHEITAANAKEYFGHIIITVRNKSCDRFNKAILNTKVQGPSTVYLSTDTVVTDDNNRQDEVIYPVEFLNSIDDAALPPHKLELKIGAIIMLIRNLHKESGLCNGTRLVVKELRENHILAETPSGIRIPIPRCDVTTNPQRYPFTMKRRQFPVKLAFSCTINKSQGQTFDQVGVDLSNPVFSHGQLYVAMSRSRHSNKIKVWTNPDLAQERSGVSIRSGRTFETLCGQRHSDEDLMAVAVFSLSLYLSLFIKSVYYIFFLFFSHLRC